ncbi:hypothetical protein [Neisseria iguanae]|uniref:hypothetical protein n=1 Tax=Neisseria iguanae TaxID=90242 RepID=UPI0011B1F92C|nr:hypothetical protein [Neisseria iguanae]
MAAKTGAWPKCPTGSVSSTVRPLLSNASALETGKQILLITRVRLTLVERKTKYVIIKKMDNFKVEDTQKVMTQALCKYRDGVLSITMDNGKEFYRHKKVAKVRLMPKPISAVSIIYGKKVVMKTPTGSSANIPRKSPISDCPATGKSKWFKML